MFTFSINSSFTDHIIGGLDQLLPKIPIAIFDGLLGFLLIRWIVRLSRWIMKLLNVAPGLRGVVASTLELILWILLAVTLLGDLGFTGLVPYFAGSFAAIGLAMAVGGSTLISDIVAGIFLARDMDFNVGDEVMVGEGPTTGIIESMDARRIRVRDKKGALHVIPNSVVERKEWVVLHRRGELTALARATSAAKRLGAAALEKSPKIGRKKAKASKDAQ